MLASKLPALSLIARAPEIAPTFAGVKTTVMLQESPAPILPAQLSVSENCALTAIATGCGPAPLLVITTNCPTLVLPSGCVANVRVVSAVAMFCAHRLKLTLITMSITNRMRETRAEKDGKAYAETTAGRMKAPQNLARIVFLFF